MNYYIITGTSRGLGEAIVQQLLVEGNTLICISRTENKQLVTLAVSKQIPMIYKTGDISNENLVEKLVTEIFEEINFSGAEKITLLNNAGTIDPIKPVGKATNQDLIANVKVNLLAPILLCTEFIKRTEAFQGDRVIVNVSSGAANRPISGWSTYCSTKAGLDMFTKTLGLEQVESNSTLKAISFSPGVMDTEMQQTIRGSERADFSSVDQFKGYHEKGMLRTPETVASILLKFLETSFENGQVYDIKDLI
ncbi:(S)-benzoin forming benzil reductase [Metabacillus herbersteinensis]|uniref:(S)-benzoin forming benzil reductase n=1 Tax=Metabacillus herbersteinensis TaxID=283816 RepID=A0ABV6GBB6_9BACI